MWKQSVNMSVVTSASKFTRKPRYESSWRANRDRVNSHRGGNTRTRSEYQRFEEVTRISNLYVKCSKDIENGVNEWNLWRECNHPFACSKLLLLHPCWCESQETTSKCFNKDPSYTPMCLTQESHWPATQCQCNWPLDHVKRLTINKIKPELWSWINVKILVEAKMAGVKNLQNYNLSTF